MTSEEEFAQKPDLLNPVASRAVPKPAGGERAWLKEDHSVIMFEWETYDTDRLRGSNALSCKGYLLGRDRSICQRCGKGYPPEVLEINHIDGNKRNNRRWNLNLMTKGCNQADENARRATLKSRERDAHLSPRFTQFQGDKFSQQETPGQYSAEEGKKHLRMRNHYNEWIRGKASVPSHDQYTFPLLRGIFSGSRIWETARKIARLAVGACGEGSNKTYYEYLLEDVEKGDIFETKAENGEVKIRYTAEFEAIVMYYLSERKPLEGNPTIKNIE